MTLSLGLRGRRFGQGMPSSNGYLVTENLQFTSAVPGDFQAVVDELMDKVGQAEMGQRTFGKATDEFRWPEAVDL
jgi:hypothetical protein